MFPFRNNAQYGPKGVHNAGYGTSGLVAVDLVGGDDMGVGIMPPNVYAADKGTVDYVCTDAIQTAVRTHNSATGDYFIYAHMRTNSSLVEGHSFAQGEMMGSLKYGTFDDTCGYASQNATQYHVHWAFAPKAGKFQVGSCILTVSTQTWACGSTVVHTGQFLAAGGGFVAGGEGGSGTSGAGSTVVSDPTFWDYILNGFLSIVDNGILKLLPEHNPFQYTYMLFNVIEIVLRLAWVLAASNINLGPLAAVMVLSIGIRAAFSIIWFIAFLFKAWKSLVPVLGA